MLEKIAIAIIVVAGVACAFGEICQWFLYDENE